MSTAAKYHTGTGRQQQTNNRGGAHYHLDICVTHGFQGRRDQHAATYAGRSHHGTAGRRHQATQPLANMLKNLGAKTNQY